MVKCGNCRFAIGKKFWIPTRPNTPLGDAQTKAREHDGIVCSGDLKVVLGEELKKDVETCEMYKKGIATFGDIRREGF